MRIGEFGQTSLRTELVGRGLKIRFGPFVVRLRAAIQSPFYEQLHALYRDYAIAPVDEIADFHVRLDRGPGMRRWLRPQARFLVDLTMPFRPLPGYMALPALEWGINWCIATRANQYLMLHSAVVEQGGRAIILPAWPGSGKTTLCAGLMLSGWRLLSDEFGLVRPLTTALVPLPRLLPLKNESIDVIRRFSSDAVLGPVFAKTRKGDVAHLKPTSSSIDRANETAEAALILFPRWQKDAPLQIEPMSKSQAFLMLATNAFNYEVLGETAFRSVEHFVRHCPCYSLVYSELNEAVGALSELLEDHARRREV
jgi:HprK-related kinase A